MEVEFVTMWRLLLSPQALVHSLVMSRFESRVHSCNMSFATGQDRCGGLSPQTLVPPLAMSRFESRVQCVTVKLKNAL